MRSLRHASLALAILLSVAIWPASAGQLPHILRVAPGATAPPPSDVTNPNVAFTAPTSAATWDNGTTTPLTGIAGTWSDNSGCATGCSGTIDNDLDGASAVAITLNANGTWTASNIDLASGTNRLTVDVVDAAGNHGTDILDVSYVPAGGGSSVTISSITGTFSNGNTITINGSSLREEDTTNYRSIFTTTTGGLGALRQGFETTDGTQMGNVDGASGAGGGDLQCGSTCGAEDTAGGTGYVDCAVSLVGNCSMKFHSIDNSPGSGASGGQSYGTYTGLNVLENYYRIYARWHSNVSTYPTSYTKAIGCAGSCGQYYFTFAGGTTNLGWSQGNMVHATNPANPGGTSDHYFNYYTGGGYLEQDVFQCVTWRWKQASTNGGTDGHVTSWWNDVQRYDGTSTNGDPNTSAGGYGLTLWTFGTVNSDGAVGSNSDFTTHMDEIAVASARVYCVVVELADSSNYATANKRILGLLKLSDTQIQAKYDDTGLTGSNRYIFVTSESQNRSAAYQVLP